MAVNFSLILKIDLCFPIISREYLKVKSSLAIGSYLIPLKMEVSLFNKQKWSCDNVLLCI